MSLIQLIQPNCRPAMSKEEWQLFVSKVKNKNSTISKTVAALIRAYMTEEIDITKYLYSLPKEP